MIIYATKKKRQQRVLLDDYDFIYFTCGKHMLLTTKKRRIHKTLYKKKDYKGTYASRYLRSD